MPVVGRISKLAHPKSLCSSLQNLGIQDDIILMIMLCNMAHLASKYRNDLGAYNLVAEDLKNNKLFLTGCKKGSKRNLKHKKDSSSHCWLCRQKEIHDEESRQLLRAKSSLQVMAHKRTCTLVLQP